MATVFDIYEAGTDKQPVRIDLEDEQGPGTTENVYVLTTSYRGTEGGTRVFATAKAAERACADFAQEKGVPYDGYTDDYDWSKSDYSACWSECGVEG